MMRSVCVVALLVCLVQAEQLKPVMKAISTDLETSESRNYVKQASYGADSWGGNSGNAVAAGVSAAGPDCNEGQGQQVAFPQPQQQVVYQPQQVVYRPAPQQQVVYRPAPQQQVVYQRPQQQVVYHQPQQQVYYQPQQVSYQPQQQVVYQPQQQVSYQPQQQVSYQPQQQVSYQPQQQVVYQPQQVVYRPAPQQQVVARPQPSYSGWSRSSSYVSRPVSSGWGSSSNGNGGYSGQVSAGGYGGQSSNGGYGGQSSVSVGGSSGGGGGYGSNSGASGLGYGSNTVSRPLAQVGQAINRRLYNGQHTDFYRNQDASRYRRSNSGWHQQPQTVNYVPARQQVVQQVVAPVAEVAAIEPEPVHQEQNEIAVEPQQVEEVPPTHEKPVQTETQQPSYPVSKQNTKTSKNTEPHSSQLSAGW